MAEICNSMVSMSNTSCGDRDERLDSLRSFCNVMLVVIHAYPFMYGNGRDWEFWFCNFVSMKLCIMILPTLFLISGYLFFVNLVDTSSYVTKIKSRIKRLVVPYIAWNCLFALAYYAIGLLSPQAADRLASLEGNNILGIPFSYVLGLSGTPVDGPLWYLRTIFVFCVLSPLLLLLLKRVKPSIFCALAFILVAVFGGHSPRFYPFYGLAAFAIGGAFACRKVSPVDFFLKRRNVFVTISLFSVAAAFMAQFLGYSQISEPADIYKLLCIPLFFSVADKINLFMKTRFVSVHIVPASFTIYCSHSLFNSVGMHFAGRVLPQFHGKMMLISCLTVLFDIMVAVLLWKLLKRICPRLLNVFDGRL